MTLLQAVTLGLIQGLTEFFPVSSSGHLVLVEALLGLNPSGVSFEVLVHVATLVAVVMVYRRRVRELAAGLFRIEAGSLRYVGKLLVASIPAGLVGIFGGEAIGRLFDLPTFAAVNLMVTGLVVYSTRWLLGRGERSEPGWGGSLAVGLAQAAAILPGISRSGTTVAMALLVRTRRERAAEFSFLLSVPAILGAALLEIPNLVADGDSIGVPAMAVAAMAAFGAGVAAIVLFLRWLRHGRFHRFAYYCWAVGGGYLLYWLLRA